MKGSCWSTKISPPRSIFLLREFSALVLDRWHVAGHGDSDSPLTHQSSGKRAGLRPFGGLPQHSAAERCIDLHRSAGRGATNGRKRTRTLSAALTRGSLLHFRHPDGFMRFFQNSVSLLVARPCT